MPKKSNSRKKIRKDKKHRKERATPNYAGETVAEWEQRMYRKGIPPLVVLFAKIYGYLATVLGESIEITRQGKFGTLAKDFNLEKWSEFYTNEKQFEQAIMKNYRKSNPILRFMILFYKRLKRESERITATELSEQINELLADKELFAEMYKIIQQGWKELNSELNANLQGKDKDEQEIKEDAVSQFFLTVWIPCMFLLGTSPATLFAKAASGDAYSIYNLIRLDKQAQYIPQISERLSFWIRNPKKYKSQLGCLDEARNGYIEEWKNSLQLKYAVIERVINYSRNIKSVGFFNLKEFSKNDLRHLFDIIAREQNQGIIDEDFPVSDEAFKKAITRGSVSKIAETGWDNFLR